MLDTKKYFHAIELLDCALLSRLVHKYIRDPIHVYIPFSKLEELIIDSGIFQRLRRIYQLQVAYSVYPGATHTRFLHSVGVMHLSGKFAIALLRTSHAYENQKAPKLPTKDTTYYVPSFESLEIDNVSDLISLLTSVRLGGLLHDVGHMPYSHAFDEAIISESKEIQRSGIRSHEDTGYYLFRNFLKDAISDFIRKNYAKQGISDDLVTSCLEYIMAPRECIENKKIRTAYYVMRQVVKEFVYPADIIDFCMRDSYFTGAIEYGRIDVDRIFMFSMIIKKQNTRSYTATYIGLMRKAIGALRAFLYSRIWLFNNVYFHKFSRLMDYTVKALLNLLKEKNIIDFEYILKGIANGDDNVLDILPIIDDSYILHKAIESKDSSLKDLATRILYRRPFLREVFSQEITIHQSDLNNLQKPNKTFEEILNDLKEDISEKLGISPEDVIVDSPPIKFFPLNPYLPLSVFPLIDTEKHKVVGVREANAWEITSTGLIDFAVLRILLPRNTISTMGRSIGDIWSEIGTIFSQEFVEELKRAFINKYSKVTYTVTM